MKFSNVCCVISFTKNHLWILLNQNSNIILKYQYPILDQQEINNIITFGSLIQSQNQNAEYTQSKLDNT